MFDSDFKDEDDFKEISESNILKISSALTKTGYVDGKTDGHNTTFQIGFDLGYKDGLKAGFSIAKFETIINILIKQNMNDNLNLELHSLRRNLQDVKDEAYFVDLDESGKSVETASKSQNMLVDNLLKTLEKKYPCINSLL